MFPDPLQHFAGAQWRPGREILSRKTKQRCQLLGSILVRCQYSAKEQEGKFGLTAIPFKIVNPDMVVAESALHPYSEFFLWHAGKSGSSL